MASSKMWHKPGDIASIPRYDVESDWDNGKRNRWSSEQFYHWFLVVAVPTPCI